VQNKKCRHLPSPSLFLAAYKTAMCAATRGRKCQRTTHQAGDNYKTFEKHRASLRAIGFDSNFPSSCRPTLRSTGWCRQWFAVLLPKFKYSWREFCPHPVMADRGPVRATRVQNNEQALMVEATHCLDHQDWRFHLVSRHDLRFKCPDLWGIVYRINCFRFRQVYRLEDFCRLFLQNLVAPVPLDDLAVICPWRNRLASRHTDTSHQHDGQESHRCSFFVR